MPMAAAGMRGELVAGGAGGDPLPHGARGGAVGPEAMAGMAHGGVAQGNRLDGEVGYGLPVGSRFVGTPRVGFGTSEYGQGSRVGYGLGVLDRASLNFELGVEAQRRNSPMLGGTSNGCSGGPPWGGEPRAAVRLSTAPAAFEPIGAS